MQTFCKDCLAHVFWFANNPNMFQVCRAWFDNLETTRDNLAALVFLDRFPVYAPMLPDIHSHVVSTLRIARQQCVWKAPRTIWMKAPVVLLGVLASNNYHACATFDGDQVQLFEATNLDANTAEGHSSCVVVQNNTLVVCSSFEVEELLIFGCDAAMHHCWLLARFGRPKTPVWPFD